MKKSVSRMIPVMLLILFLLPSVSFAISGSGTKDDPWLIGDEVPSDARAFIEDGKFTIEGAGDTVDQNLPDEIPWKDQVSSIRSVEISAGITSIGSMMFYETDRFDAVVFADDSQMKSIGRDAFSGCRSLKGVDLPDGLTSLGAGAFAFCTQITRLTIPGSVTAIGGEAFNGCLELSAVTMGSSAPPSLGSDVFYGCRSLSAIYVPYGSKAAYVAAANWSDYQELITELPPAHHFSFSAKGAVLSATCTDADCYGGYNIHPLTLTLDLPSRLAYDGYPKRAAYKSYEITAWEEAGLKLPAINYAPLENLTDGEPVNMGTYTASASMKGMDSAAMVEFTITESVYRIAYQSKGDAQVSFSDPDGGAAPSLVIKGDTVTFLVSAADTAYAIDTVTAVTAGGETVEVTRISDTASVYRFVMPGDDVTVTATVTKILIPVEMIILNPDTLTMKPGESRKVTVTIYPENATVRTLTWTMDAEDVVKIAADGTVTALKEGKVKVTVSSGNGVSAGGTVTVKADPVEPIEYNMIRGAKQVILTDADEAVFASDADFSKFVDVLLDGKVLPKSRYTARSGSTVITLKQAAIKGLKPGEHNLIIRSADGEAATTFTVKEPMPKTGDGAKPALWVMLLLTALAGVTLTAKGSRKQRS